MNMNEKQQLQVERFIQLKKLNQDELQVLARELGVDASLTGPDLVQAVIKAEQMPQSWKLPQAFALKTKHDNEAKEFVRLANAAILPQVDGALDTTKIKKRSFPFATKNGDTYEVPCPYVKTKDATLKMLLEKDWLVALPSQAKLLGMLREDPTKFECNFVRRQDKNKRFHLMLHVQPKN